MKYVRLRDSYTPLSEGETVEVLDWLVIPGHETHDRYGDVTTIEPEVVALVVDGYGEIETVSLGLLRRVKEDEVGR